MRKNNKNEEKQKKKSWPKIQFFDTSSESITFLVRTRSILTYFRHHTFDASLIYAWIESRVDEKKKTSPYSESKSEMEQSNKNLLIFESKAHYT